MRLKLIKRTIPFYKKGKKIGSDVVLPVVYPEYSSYSKADKNKLKNAYRQNWENLDELYRNILKQKDIDLHNAVNAHAERMQEELRQKDPITYRHDFVNPTRTYVSPADQEAVELFHRNIFKDIQSAKPNFDQSTVDTRWQEETQQAQGRQKSSYPREDAQFDVIRANDPFLLLENFEYDIQPGSNVQYNSPVKQSANEAFYNELIKKANAKYQINFRSRSDVARFQELTGAKAVDGIIGPETEALLDYYFGDRVSDEYKGTTLNKRKMYRKQSNKTVYGNTSKITSKRQNKRTVRKQSYKGR